jgi:ATP-dependent Clp protease ATP-binding subunit ClpA
MSDTLIQQAARLMQEQTAAYRRLEAACSELGAALVQGEPSEIESMTRAGESELLKMRSRLLQLMGTLTAFADARTTSPETSKLTHETRATFEAASSELTRAARDFTRARSCSAALANNGSTFATACIQTCGIQPVTYRAPYARRGEGRAWV